MNDKELTEREKQILEEGNEKQIASMKENKSTIERRAITSGRYPLWLAVEMMTDNLKARWALRDQLSCDAERGRLPMFRKGDILPAEYKLSPLELKEESDEYYWDDLNSWLRSNAPRIEFVFPGPADHNETKNPTDVIPDSLGTNGANEKLPPYLTTSQIVACFGGFMGVNKPAKVLSEYPLWARRNGALISKGRRGNPSKSKLDTSGWNPVQFALNLLEKRPLPILVGIGVLRQQNLDAVFGMKLLSGWKSIWTKKKPH